MKVIVIKSISSDLNDWRESCSILMIPYSAPSIEANFHDGEVEDANLSRDFNDVYKIPDMLKAAYEAGQQGEKFELEEKVEI